MENSKAKPRASGDSIKIVENCGNCRFSRTGHQLGLRSIRHRDLFCCMHPPTIQILAREGVEYAHEAQFPEVEPIQWCGCWQRGVM